LLIDLPSFTFQLWEIRTKAFVTIWHPAFGKSAKRGQERYFVFVQQLSGGVKCGLQFKNEEEEALFRST